MELLLAPARAKDFTLERSQRCTRAVPRSDCAALPLQLPPARDAASNPSRGDESVTAMPTASGTENAAQTMPSTVKRVRHSSITGISKIYHEHLLLLYHKQNCAGFSNNCAKDNRGKITKPIFTNKLANFSSMNTLWKHTGKYPGSHHQDVNSEGKVVFYIRLFWQ